jgi:hypothetical protein
MTFGALLLVKEQSPMDIDDKGVFLFFFIFFFSARETSNESQAKSLSIPNSFGMYSLLYDFKKHLFYFTTHFCITPLISFSTLQNILLK